MIVKKPPLFINGGFLLFNKRWSLNVGCHVIVKIPQKCDDTADINFSCLLAVPVQTEAAKN
ncbi:MAG: hypothetical protein ACI8R1_001150 [Psychrobacter glaciei]|jgi:hypothetical protein